MVNITPPQLNFSNKNAYCGWCGTKFTEQKLYPRKCFRCHNDTYINPIPITVALVPVWEDIGEPHQAGLLIGKREIEPKKGEWALPGGYLNVGETWQEGAAREISEEMGLETDPTHYELFGVELATNSNLIIFGLYRGPVRRSNIKFVPNEECSEMDLALVPMQLAFPTHTQALYKWCLDQ